MCEQKHELGEATPHVGQSFNQEEVIETRIWLRGRYHNINLDSTVNTTRAMRSFCVYNNLRDCMVRSQGGWYKIALDGILELVTPYLNAITFRELYKKLKD